MTRIVVLLAAAGWSLPATAQSTWYFRGSDADVRIVAANAKSDAAEHRIQDVRVLRGPTPAPVELPAGEYAVHFAVDADGKPRSLTFDVNDGDEVRVAIGRAAAAPFEVVANDAAWRRASWGSGESFSARTIGAADARDVRITGEFVLGAEAVGLVARWVDATQHYRCGLDANGELLLTRELGGSVTVLARAVTTLRSGEAVELAMQVEGFRLAVFLDDALVLQAFDGAFEAGAVGTWTTGPDPAAQCRRFTVAASAAVRDSAAVVRSEGRAVLHVATNVSPGVAHLAELWLDRPGPPLPMTENGVEPWLVREAAAPRVLLADLRGSLNANGIGEVPGDGNLHVAVHWPASLLRGHFALLRSLFVASDGQAALGRSPAVALRF